MEKQIEILAPAGSYEGMKAAMNAGCDAVYIGGSRFGARAYANNPDQETLLKAIDEAHIRGKKLYLTVNTLIKEKERTEELYRFMEKYYLQGLDAVIVQDVGVMHFIHRYFPKLPIHASTQTTITMAQGIELLRDCGVTRLVTARELSLKEIREIRRNSDIEIETFVHGAVCYSYSGQCLMSSMIGGRSGNRGRCAQPCRMPYRFYVEDKRVETGENRYLLSPKDICTIELIPEMIEAGIDSFKIEGRMKRPEYAATVSALYKKYVELYFSLGKEGFKRYIYDKDSDYPEDMINLQDIYNRGGFSQGYLKTYHGKSMMSLARPNHSGVYIGEVIGRKGSQVRITLGERINAQDILEIRDREEAVFEFTVKDSMEPGQTLEIQVGRRPSTKDREKGSQKASLPNVRIGCKVYRTKNNRLLEQLAGEYMQKDSKQEITGYLKAKAGERLSLSLIYQSFTVTAYHNEVQAAVRQPMTKDKIAVQIEKTGDTLFKLKQLEVEMDGEIFIPVAWLNEIRREAIRLLESAITLSYRRKDRIQYKDETIYHETESDTASPMMASPPGKSTDTEFADKSKKSNGKAKSEDIGVCAGVQTREQLEAVLSYRKITSVYVDYDALADEELSSYIDRAKSAEIHFYLSLPHICRLSVYEKLKKDIFTIKEENIRGYIVKNFEEISLLKEIYQDRINDIDIILNYSMYVYNKEAKIFWKEKGISHFTAPVELNAQELRTLQINDCDSVVYGYIPLMVSAQCLMENTEGCKRCRHGERRNSYLTDRMNKRFYVQTGCSGCYNVIYNGQCLSLIKYVNEVKGLNPRNIRIDFTLEAPQEIKIVLDTFHAAFLDGRVGELPKKDYTTGHFKRGIE